MAVETQEPVAEAAASDVPSEDAADAGALTRPITFICSRRGFKLTIEPADWETNNKGKRYNHTEGQHVEFNENNGFAYTTDDPEVVEFLREHRLYNSWIWEEGRPPNAPRPTLEEQMEAITTASAKHDAEAILALIEAEEAKHKRPAVLTSAKAALHAIAEADE